MTTKKEKTTLPFVIPDNRFDRGTIVKCKVKECLRPTMIKKHGLCRAHYMRYWQGLDLGGPIPPRRKLDPFKKKTKAGKRR